MWPENCTGNSPTPTTSSSPTPEWQFATSSHATADDFRARETAAIRDAVTRDQQVISVGGGAVLLPENHELLSAAGVCVWLQAAPEALFGRIQADPASADNRPSLTDQDGLDEVRLLLEQRAPLYAACAQRVVDTNQKSPQEVASDVLAAVTCDRPFSG